MGNPTVCAETTIDFPRKETAKQSGCDEGPILAWLMIGCKGAKAFCSLAFSLALGDT